MPGGVAARCRQGLSRPDWNSRTSCLHSLRLFSGEIRRNSSSRTCRSLDPAGEPDAIVLIALRHLRAAEGQTPRLQQLATVGIQTAGGPRGERTKPRVGCGSSSTHVSVAKVAIRTGSTPSTIAEASRGARIVAQTPQSSGAWTALCSCWCTRPMDATRANEMRARTASHPCVRCWSRSIASLLASTNRFRQALIAFATNLRLRIYCLPHFR